MPPATAPTVLDNIADGFTTGILRSSSGVSAAPAVRNGDSAGVAGITASRQERSAECTELDLASFASSRAQRRGGGADALASSIGTNTLGTIRASAISTGGTSVGASAGTGTALGGAADAFAEATRVNRKGAGASPIAAAISVANAATACSPTVRFSDLAGARRDDRRGTRPGSGVTITRAFASAFGGTGGSVETASGGLGARAAARTCRRHGRGTGRRRSPRPGAGDRRAGRRLRRRRGRQRRRGDHLRLRAICGGRARRGGWQTDGRTGLLRRRRRCRRCAGDGPGERRDERSASSEPDGDRGAKPLGRRRRPSGVDPARHESGRWRARCQHPCHRRVRRRRRRGLRERDRHRQRRERGSGRGTRLRR
jgi:hypothetical protein